MTSSTSLPAKLIRYILEDAPVMEPPLKVTLAGGWRGGGSTPLNERRANAAANAVPVREQKDPCAASRANSNYLNL